MSTFSENQIKCAIVISVLSDIVEDNYESALKTIAMQKNVDPTFKDLSIIKDAAKVLSLRYTSQINQYIIASKPYEQGIEKCFNALVFIFKNLVTDFEDNHYKQVVINLKMTREVAHSKMDGYVDKFDEWIQLFDTYNIDSAQLDQSWEPKYSEDLAQTIDRITNTNNYVFNECYNSKNMGVIYSEW